MIAVSGIVLGPDGRARLHEHALRQRARPRSRVLHLRREDHPGDARPSAAPGRSRSGRAPDSSTRPSRCSGGPTAPRSRAAPSPAGRRWPDGPSGRLRPGSSAAARAARSRSRRPRRGRRFASPWGSRRRGSRPRTASPRGFCRPHRSRMRGRRRSWTRWCVGAVASLALVAGIAPEARPELRGARRARGGLRGAERARARVADAGAGLAGAAARRPLRGWAGERVGDVRVWPALDRRPCQLYLKEFTLRAVGTYMEVWVASGQDAVSRGLSSARRLPQRRPRAALRRAGQYLAQQFDGNIYPRMTQAFSEPRPRDGSRAQITARNGLPPDYYVGDGRRVVALVDNIRDESFFDVNIRVGVGGVFVPSLDEQVDRNVITIDGVDWLHRSGSESAARPGGGRPLPQPGGAPVPHRGDLRARVPAPPRVVPRRRRALVDQRGVVHVLEAVTGYVDNLKPITDVGFSGSIQCFLGNSIQQTSANPNPTPGGPENSLTRLGRQGRHRDRLRLRRRRDVHALPRRPARARVPVRGPSRPGQRARVRSQARRRRGRRRDGAVSATGRR